MSKHTRPVILFVGLTLIAACSGEPKLIEAEKLLGTDGTDLAKFHKLAEADRGLSLNFPGYIIGIEKSRQDSLNNGSCSIFSGHDEEVDKLNRQAFIDELQDADEGEQYYDRVRGILSDCKRMYVSHIVSYDIDPQAVFPLVQEKRLFSVYSKPYMDAYINADVAHRPNIFQDGLRQLGRLTDTIRAEVATGAYTHILFYSMGWNTDQQEAIRNYNSLIGQLQARGDDSFHPLFIGLTWPSEWTWPWALEALGKPLSYVVKAPDADEVGVLWGSYILRKILIPAKQASPDIPLILLGHSFGARVITRSVFGYPGQFPELAQHSAEDIDLVLAIQGAFSVNRFVNDAGIEGAPYQNYRDYAKKFVLTWSRNDTANPLAAFATGGKHAGGKPGYKSSLEYPEVFDQFRINVEPDLDCNYDLVYTGTSISSDEAVAPEAQQNEWAAIGQSAARVAMVDASDLVRFTPYNKGGKSHSDIYTPGMADFIWDVISRLDLPGGQSTANGQFNSKPPECWQ